MRDDRDQHVAFNAHELKAQARPEKWCNGLMLLPECINRIAERLPFGKCFRVSSGQFFKGPSENSIAFINFFHPARPLSSSVTL